jgi:hypothetical protein
LNRIEVLVNHLIALLPACRDYLLAVSRKPENWPRSASVARVLGITEEPRSETMSSDVSRDDRHSRSERVIQPTVKFPLILGIN